MKNKLSFLFTFFLVSSSSFNASAQTVSDLQGGWTVIAQKELLYDGTNLVRINELDIDEGHLKLIFEKNQIVDYVLEDGGIIKFRYKLSGKRLQLSPVDPDAAEPIEFNIKLVNDFLHMYLDIYDDPEVDELEDPNLKMHYVLKQEFFYPS